MTDHDGAPIIISRDEALSQRVDNLLTRQNNLRGIRGSTARTKGPWYLRNWLILALSGLVMALAAWALLEPVFDDMHYIQGRLKAVDPSSPRSQAPPVEGSIRIGATELWLLNGCKLQEPDGTRVPLDVSQLVPDTEIGVWADTHDVGGRTVGIAAVVVLNPPPPRGKALLSLESQAQRSSAAGFFLFALVSAFVGLGVGAVEGLVCRQPRRALLSGIVGFFVGLIGGMLATLLASIVYSLATLLAHTLSGGTVLSPLGFLLQVMGRSIAWAIAGMAMGLGQGVVLRSRRLLLFGFLGGVVGGLLGGFLFDPIYFLLHTDETSAHWSRLVGLAIIGAAVGAMIGVVELLARDAWLRMTQGPLAGKEFLLFKDSLRLGASPQSDIYLFSDPLVEQHHATLRTVGEAYEIENHSQRQPLAVNGRPVPRARLRHGDQITIGATVFLFQTKQA